ncbi:hypothetical protein A2316_02150 [Candidatus Falkowbacteria bacterium RIFOXYB2_FULL_38_15]|uniref:Uncharacterized protein n=1 Tax=Candidatus Falkowbacteria bacterium RIFOXYA2_FULL_38_12 TaxID=1797993 RepID=A0A1F5S4Q4_9BACT|nr:MAG: hypothetical protein A2257_00450 [Candidatus Falkowbacteria bacterium RIFOXYA2_FULL_38_12]OGF32612.1 MAG: hypothetical protein A2316_02150 [Candidatus Falkowbacteria bacterium RIFOXYB2_FULL_38_15]OGF44579.1 MAG: hypothetical protein A2555_00875 [Candidatus Falkowbacteria bacterium RIFOXYD2_FULL_39_16]
MSEERRAEMPIVVILLKESNDESNGSVRVVRDLGEEKDGEIEVFYSSAGDLERIALEAFFAGVRYGEGEVPPPIIRSRGTPRPDPDIELEEDDRCLILEGAAADQWRLKQAERVEKE